MEGFVRGDLDARLDEARLNSRSLAALASPRRPANPPTPATPSRVTAMREQVEARERQAKQEAEELLAKGKLNINVAVLMLSSLTIAFEDWDAVTRCRGGLEARSRPHFSFICSSDNGRQLARLFVIVAPSIPKQIDPHARGNSR